MPVCFEFVLLSRCAKYRLLQAGFDLKHCETSCFRCVRRHAVCRKSDFVERARQVLVFVCEVVKIGSADVMGHKAIALLLS